MPWIRRGKITRNPRKSLDRSIETPPASRETPRQRGAAESRVEGARTTKKAGAPWLPACECGVVGDTGIEPVASSVSGKRAPAAPIAHITPALRKRGKSLSERHGAASACRGEFAWRRGCFGRGFQRPRGPPAPRGTRAAFECSHPHPKHPFQQRLHQPPFRFGGHGSLSHLPAKNQVRWENAVFCQELARLRKPDVKKRLVCERQEHLGKFRAQTWPQIELV